MDLAQKRGSVQALIIVRKMSLLVAQQGLRTVGTLLRASGDRQ